MRYISLILLLLVGCASEQTFHKVVILPRTEIHIVSDRSYFEHFRNTKVEGYADGDKIYVIGRKFKGKIYFDHYVLGHEFAHILGNVDPDIGNPDN